MPLTKNANPDSINSPGILKALFLASRPKTWIASISPVVIGISMVPKTSISWSTFTLTFLFGLLIQIGTNFANDAFDGMKGTDKERVGPKRAVQEGWISAKGMLRATWITLILALLIALPLMLKTGLWSFFLGALCAACALGYTAGPKPFSYTGLSELFILVFFGPVACVGTYFLQLGSMPLKVWIASIAPALFSCALLTVNNLRDELSDRRAQKKTLVVRMGQSFGLLEYRISILGALCVPSILCFLGLTSPLLQGASPLLILGMILCYQIGKTGEYFSFLPKTSLLFWIYTLSFALLASAI